MSWTEKFGSFNATGDAAWEDYDIEAGQGVPASSVAVIVVQNTNALNHRNGGVRENGSALDRFLLIHDAGGLMKFTVQVDDNGLIEIYAANFATMNFYVIGYFEGVTFTEAWDSKIVTDNAGWVDWDLFTSYGTPKERVHEIGFRTVSAEEPYGARKNGSAVDRKTPNLADLTTGSLYVQSDADGVIEIYDPSASDSTYYHAGYFNEGVAYVEDLQTFTNLVTIVNTWQDYTLAAGVANMVSEILLHPTALVTIGARANGGVLDKMLATSQYHLFSNIVRLDADKKLEFRASSTTFDRANYVGYITLSQTINESISDGFSLGDDGVNNLRIQQHHNRAWTDAFSMADPVTLLTFFVNILSLLDGFSFNEAPLLQRTLNRSLLEGLSLGDPLLRSILRQIGLSDGFSLADPLTTLLTRRVLAFDGYGYADAVNLNEVLRLALIDAFGHADRLLQKFTLNQQLVDRFTYGDSVQVTTPIYLMLAEGFSMADSATLYLVRTHMLSLQDSLGLADSLYFHRTYNRVLSDAYRFGDIFNYNEWRNLQIMDAFTLAEIGEVPLIRIRTTAGVAETYHTLAQYLEYIRSGRLPDRTKANP